jgi:hypothetical protein
LWLNGFICFEIFGWQRSPETRRRYDGVGNTELESSVNPQTRMSAPHVQGAISMNDPALDDF